MADSDTSKQEAPKPEDIRPTRLPNGTYVQSGPIPKGGSVQSVQPGQIVFAGSTNGAFNIGGARFDQPGTVYIGGKQATVTAWNNNLIKGVVPVGAKVGDEIVVTDGTGKVQKGKWEPPKEPTPQPAPAPQK